MTGLDLLFAVLVAVGGCWLAVHLWGEEEFEAPFDWQDEGLFDDEAAA